MVCPECEVDYQDKDNIIQVGLYNICFSCKRRQYVAYHNNKPYTPLKDLSYEERRKCIRLRNSKLGKRRNNNG